MMLFSVYAEMSLKQEIILIISSLIAFSHAAPTRILVSCDKNGFSCNMVNSKRLVTYQCPSNTQDIIAYLWNFGEPSNTAWITIKNCENVEIDMSCTSYRRSFESLTLENITNLKFSRTVSVKKNPTKIVLKKIANLAVIPENTFTFPYMVKYTGEVQQHELQEIEFDDVHIGTIEGHAFHSLRGFRNFSWNNVKVDRLHANAIKIDFNTTEKHLGIFSMTNSTLEISEYLSFQIYVKEATFRNNKFVEIMPGGINGTIELFVFANNVVNTLQSGSISILSKSVNILDNTFNYLKSGSFEKISPGLLVDSHTSFGNLEFTYKFNNNNIIYIDAGSLNPDMEAYNKVSTNLIFSFNTFLCSCDNLGWIMSSLGHGFSSAMLQDFYETITDEEASNICSGVSCKKTIASVRHFLKDGQCSPNMTMEYLCQTTTIPPSTTEDSSHIEKSDKVIWLNRTDMLMSKSDIVKAYSFYSICLISFIFSLN